MYLIQYIIYIVELGNTPVSRRILIDREICAD